MLFCASDFAEMTFISFHVIALHTSFMLFCESYFIKITLTTFSLFFRRNSFIFSGASDFIEMTLTSFLLYPFTSFVPLSLLHLISSKLILSIFYSFSTFMLFIIFIAAGVIVNYVNLQS